MRAAHLKQVKRIKKLPGYETSRREFELEYALAKELHETRRQAQLTQAEIAERMGTTQSVVSRIEGGANVSVQTLARYASACGKHLEVHLV